MMLAKCTVLVAILALTTLGSVWAEDVMEPPKSVESMDESTESPIADMALLSDAAEKKDDTKMASADVHAKDTQRHTVADFIIHPLIAFKPRQPADEAMGKQAATDSSTTTTPSPWQFFGFNAGQGIGSSVSSLAGSVTGWLNDRIQLPGLMETPVRDQSTSTSTTTTTTVRPDVVVRVQHRASTRAPIIAINNQNRPNRLDLDSDEEDDDDVSDDEEFDDEFDDDDDEGDYEEDDEEDHQVAGNKRRRGQNSNNNRNKAQQSSYEYDDDEEEDDDFGNDDADDEEEDNSNAVQRPNKRRNQVRPQNGNRNRNGVRNGSRVRQQANRNSNRNGNGNGSRRFENDGPRRFPAQPVHYEDSDESVEEDDAEASEELYYGNRPSLKRSQNGNAQFMQRGPQSFLNQIRQLTRGQTPAEIGNMMRKPSGAAQSGSANKKRRQQATMLINRNGQTVYMAPELMQPMATVPYYAQAPVIVRNPTSMYPQPPLTLPLKRKGRPTQYITIPWSQLGIAPPDELVSVTEGIQSQPLILNIPQSAINTMQSPNRKKKRPALTAEAVPLLAEASLMDVFKPPQIPPSRTATKKPAAGNGKRKRTTTKKPMVVLPQRVRPATVVEMAPAMENDSKVSEETAMQAASSPMTAENATPQQSNSNLRSPNAGEAEGDFIIVGDDNEPGLTRQVQPVYGDARYTGVLPYFELVNANRFGHFRKQGRSLGEAASETADAPTEMIGGPDAEEPLAVEATETVATVEQQIPVQIIEDGAPVEVKTTASDAPTDGQQAATA